MSLQTRSTARAERAAHLADAALAHLRTSNGSTAQDVEDAIDATGIETLVALDRLINAGLVDGNCRELGEWVYTITAAGKVAA